MCGLVGFVGAGTRAELCAMMDMLAHRGPDGKGLFVDEPLRVFLGHQRLSILDITGGHQPMWNEDGQVGVIFNGEIYNHAELRQDLQARGHIFRSDHSDTEVLVHGYEEWGPALPERLNGMFAFAVFDRSHRRLFLARDRFGEKPLYYCQGRDFFGFASELSALCRHPSFDQNLNQRSLHKLFAYGYIPAPSTLFRSAHKLPGGSSLIYDIESGTVSTTAYWRFRLEPDESLTEADEPALSEELTGLLSQAVRRRLISDVPLGIFLSGGVDSSTALAMAIQHHPADSLKTFTIGFTEPSFDEARFAQEVSALFGTDHQVRYLDIDAARALIPQVLGKLDEPFGDASILPTYLLSAFTREQVTVALSGDGGDELFAGYDPFKALAPAQLYRQLVPQGLHRGMRRLADLLPISARNMSFDFKVRRGLAGMSYPPAVWNPIWMSPLEPSDMQDVFESQISYEDLYDEAISLWESDPHKSFIDRTLEFFTTFYLQDDILFKADRAAMMSSLESRAIFLDNDLVDFCRRLPNRFKIRNGERKYLLKKAMRRYLPADILSRPKKGFGIPLAKWLRELAPPAGPLPLLQPAAVARRWNEHRSKTADHRLFLWTWLSLQQCLSPATAVNEIRQRGAA